jgi:hypothetical protein
LVSLAPSSWKYQPYEMLAASWTAGHLAEHPPEHTAHATRCPLAAGCTAQSGALLQLCKGPCCCAVDMLVKRHGCWPVYALQLGFQVQPALLVSHPADSDQMSSRSCTACSTVLQYLIHRCTCSLPVLDGHQLYWFRLLCCHLDPCLKPAELQEGPLQQCWALVVHAAYRLPG